MMTKRVVKKPQLLSPINIELINNNSKRDINSNNDDDVLDEKKPYHPQDCNDEEDYYQMGDDTYRNDGVSIGPDYLRLEGCTVTRGELVPSALSFDGTIGRGAFSKVQRAVWTRTTSSAIITSNQNNETDDDDVVDKRKDKKKKFSTWMMNSLRRTKSSSSRSIKEDDDCLENDNEKENNNDTETITNNNKTSTLVAVKQTSLLSSSTQVRQMLIKELRALCRVDCPCLLKLHGAFLEEDTVTMVLEYMDQGSLDQVLKQQQKQPQQPFLLKEQTIASISYQVLWGLSYLHYDKTLHRDIKPGNILLNAQGQVKLCDFGLASLAGASGESLHSTFVGTTKFMAPERLKGETYGRSSDIWSVGLVLIQCLTGTPPFEDIASIVDLFMTIEETSNLVTMLLLQQQQQEQEPQNEAEGLISSGLYEILLGCLQKDPSKRMPAGVLLQSPWFSKEHGIENLEHAMHKNELFSTL